MADALADVVLAAAAHSPALATPAACSANAKALLGLRDEARIARM